MNLTNITPNQRQSYSSESVDEKIDRSKLVIKQILMANPLEEQAVAWTGGKDSTLLLWLIKQVVDEHKLKLPKCMFVDEGDVFEEIKEFVAKLKDAWQLDVSIAHNQDVSGLAKNLGDQIKVADLNQDNQAEIKRLGLKEASFAYLPESFVGNHLMKTVASNNWIKANKIKYLYVGVRWDEQGARGEDDYLRSLKKPNHFRVEPILHITERDVWSITKKYHIPYVKLYESGFRSLGAKTTTNKTTDVPAWDQDIENTSERAGRQQDKEKLMERLRALGYM